MATSRRIAPPRRVQRVGARYCHLDGLAGVCALAGANYRIDGPLTALWLLASLPHFGALDLRTQHRPRCRGRGPRAQCADRGGLATALLGLWLTYFGGVFGAHAADAARDVHTVDVHHPAHAAAGHSLHGLQACRRPHAGSGQPSGQGQLASTSAPSRRWRRQSMPRTRSRTTTSGASRTGRVELAHALGVNDDAEIQALKAASLLHDVGKLGDSRAHPQQARTADAGRVRDHEASRAGRRRHPVGDRLSRIRSCPSCGTTTRTGTARGIPTGLAGEEIPIGARILAVVDCFDALTSDRPYRRAWTDAAALQILTERKATMYDPRVVDAFFACHDMDSMKSPSAAPPRAGIAGTVARRAVERRRAGPGVVELDGVLRARSRARRCAHRAPSRSVSGQHL